MTPKLGSLAGLLRGYIGWKGGRVEGKAEKASKAGPGTAHLAPTKAPTTTFYPGIFTSATQFFFALV